jgi:methionyl-tRNA synthetase
VLLHPVLPERMQRFRRSLGLGDSDPVEAELRLGALEPGTAIGAFEPVFPRVDAKEWLAAEPAALAAPAAAAPAPAAAAAAPAPAAAAPAVAKAAPSTSAAAPGLISVDEFFRADLRVARIKVAERVEKSKKLLRLVVDLGGEERQIVAGIAEAYAPESLIGRSVIVVANLKPAKLMGVESQGMLLAASLDGRPILASFEQEVAPGTKVK